MLSCTIALQLTIDVFKGMIIFFLFLSSLFPSEKEKNEIQHNDMINNFTLNKNALETMIINNERNNK